MERPALLRAARDSFSAPLWLTLAVVLNAGCSNTESPVPDPVIDGGASRFTLPEAGLFDASAGPGPASNADADAGTDQRAVPAEVCKVLQNNGCLDCHTRPTAHGAPAALTQRADFTGNAKDGSPLAQKLLERIQSAQLPMPPASTGRPLPSAADVTSLKSWIEGGMKGTAGGECGAASDGDGGIKVSPGITWATRGWPEGQCDYVLTLGAHNDPKKPLAQDENGFQVPNEETHYHCFYEKVPWGPNEHVQAIAMRARIETPDDKKVVHHLVVSGQKLTDTGFGTAKPNNGGDHKPCLNPNGGTMAVWAPGLGNPATYPEDVGLLLPSGDDAYIELQIHYNNQDFGPLYTPKLSKARYDICVTKKLKPNEAGVVWFGYENTFLETLLAGEETANRLDNQNNGTAIGRCSAKSKGRILSIMPHMHEQGVHGKFEIVGKNGMSRSVVDSPFDFHDQPAYYQEDLWVEQGEYVRTTCRWKKNPVFFGFGSDNEMCFFYTLVYPIQAFQALPLLGERGFVGGDMACAGMRGP